MVKAASEHAAIDAVLKKTHEQEEAVTRRVGRAMSYPEIARRVRELDPEGAAALLAILPGDEPRE
jgi:hypothetical protein